MVMQTLQIRLSQGLIKRVDALIKEGLYSSRSDAVRDAVRRLVLDDLVGISLDKQNSVKQVRKLRTTLSQESFDLDEINKLAK